MINNLICVGSIAGAYGVRGELRIKSFCADPEAIDTYTPLLSEDGSREFKLSLIGPIKQGFNARIVGVDTKEDADALRGTQLWTDRAQLPELPDDEFYYSDLIGLAVFDTGGVRLGAIKNVQEQGAGDLLEIDILNHSDTVFVPFNREFVPLVDLTGLRIIIDPPDGLMPG